MKLVADGPFPAAIGLPSIVLPDAPARGGGAPVISAGAENTDQCTRGFFPAPTFGKLNPCFGNYVTASPRVFAS